MRDVCQRDLLFLDQRKREVDLQNLVVLRITINMEDARAKSQKMYLQDAKCHAVWKKLTQISTQWRRWKCAVQKKEETGVGEAALMGALMTADEAWSGPKISISIVRRIPETWPPPETYCVLGSPGQTKKPIQMGRVHQVLSVSGSSSTSTRNPSAWHRL